MRLDLWNEAKTSLHFQVKEPLVLWYGFKGTTGAYDTMTIRDDSQSSSAVLPQSGPLGQEPRGLDSSPPLATNYPWDSEHSLPLWVSSSPCENKTVHWLWDTFLSRYHSQTPLKGTVYQMPDNSKRYPMTVGHKQHPVCWHMHTELLEGDGFFQNHRKQHDGASRTKPPGMKCEFCAHASLHPFPTENLTLSSLVTLGLGNKFLHAPWLFPKSVLISDSVEIFFQKSRLKAENQDPSFLSLLLCP